MSARDTFGRFIRGLLLFVAGALVGGTLIYLGLGQQRSMRGLAGVPASTQPVDPAQPPAQPIGSSPHPDMPPDVPAGQFDTTPEADTATATPLVDASKLIIPVQGVQAAQLTDTFTQARSGGRVHDAIDIMSPAGTPVYAAADGTVAKLFESKLGGTTIYEFDTTGAIAYYYAHLQSYAPGLVEGKALKQGEVIGYVGSTGNASPTAPHLHFAIMVLGPDKHWWQGTAINPYPLLSGATPH